MLPVPGRLPTQQPEDVNGPNEFAIVTPSSLLQPPSPLRHGVSPMTRRLPLPPQLAFATLFAAAVLWLVRLLINSMSYLRHVSYAQSFSVPMYGHGRNCEGTRHDYHRVPLVVVPLGPNEQMRMCVGTLAVDGLADGGGGSGK